MPRSESKRITGVKERLLIRIQSGLEPPGTRFFSNRALATRFGVSYQTAHRIITELTEEGWLERREASGTYLRGARSLKSVDLIFNPRAKREGSFGNYLLGLLTGLFAEEKIPFKIKWDDKKLKLSDSSYPICWEATHAMSQLKRAQAFALLLNDTPPAGLFAGRVDSVSTNDFSGGASAAEIFLKKYRSDSKYLILAGPENDARSIGRVAGFRSILPHSLIVHVGDWQLPSDSDFLMRRIIRYDPAAIFCCNDRLAEGIIERYKDLSLQRPSLIGFDDAPIAETLNLTTIGIPWEELVHGACLVAKNRLNGYKGSASSQSFSPKPVMRNL